MFGIEYAYLPAKIIQGSLNGRMGIKKTIPSG